MSRRYPRLLLVAALLVLAASPAAPAAAARPHAPRVVDPQHLPARLPHGLVAVEGDVSPASVNGLLNADMAIYVSNGASYTSLAAEGRLHLSLVSGSTAHYVGSFFDDLGGGAIFSASGEHVAADTLNGDYVVNTANGRFTFHIGGTFTSSVPSKYGHSATVGTILYGAHAYTVRTPLAVTMGSFTVGAFQAPSTGTLSLTTDAIGYLVPLSSQRHVNSSYSYTVHGSLHGYRITSYGQYFPPDGSGDGSLTVVLKVDGVIYYIIGAKEDTGGARTISGNALGGYGASLISSTFSAH